MAKFLIEVDATQAEAGLNRVAKSFAAIRANAKATGKSMDSAMDRFNKAISGTRTIQRQADATKQFQRAIDGVATSAGRASKSPFFSESSTGKLMRAVRATDKMKASVEGVAVASSRAGKSPFFSDSAPGKLMSANRAVEKMKANLDAVSASSQRAGKSPFFSESNTGKLMAANQAVERLKASTEGLAGQQVAVGQAAQVGGRGMRQFALAAQQSGYQIADFAVQVGSGQNAMVAFLQQGTQIVQFFGPWGAVIGAAGAVVGALAMGITAAANSADKAESSMDALGRTIASQESDVDALAARYRELGEAQAAVEKINLLASQRAAVKEYKAAVEGLREVITSAVGDKYSMDFDGRWTNNKLSGVNDVLDQMARGAVGADEGLKRLETALLRSGTVAGFQSDEMLNAAGAVASAGKEVVEAGDRLKFLEDVLSGKETQSASERFKKIQDTLESLKSQYITTYQAQKDFREGADVLAKSLAAGEISMKDYREILGGLTSDYRDSVSAANGLEDAITKQKQAMDEVERLTGRIADLEAEREKVIKSSADAQTKALDTLAAAQKQAAEAHTDALTQFKDAEQSAASAIDDAKNQQIAARRELTDAWGQFNDRMIAAEDRLAEARQEAADAVRAARDSALKAERRYADEMQSIRESMISAEERYVDRMNQIEQARLDVHRSTEEKIRELRRSQMDDAHKQADIAAEAYERVQSAEKLFASGQVDMAMAQAEKVQSLAGRLDDIDNAIRLTERAGAVMGQAADAVARGESRDAALELQNAKADAVERERKAIEDLKAARDDAAKREIEAQLSLREIQKDVANEQRMAFAALHEARINNYQSQIQSANQIKAAQQQLADAERTFAEQQATLAEQQRQRDVEGVEAQQRIKEATQEARQALIDGDVERARAAADAIQAASERLSTEQDIKQAIKTSSDIAMESYQAEISKAQSLVTEQNNIIAKYNSRIEILNQVIGGMVSAQEQYAQTGVKAAAAANKADSEFKDATQNISKAHFIMRDNAIRAFDQMKSAAQGTANSIKSSFENTISIGDLSKKISPFSVPGFAGGGIVRGPGTSTSDSILARLSNEEGVINARAVDYYGEDAIHRMNNLSLPKFADGGIVGPQPVVSSVAQPVTNNSTTNNGGDTYEITVNVSGNVDADQLIDDIRTAAKRRSARGKPSIVVS